MYVFLHYKKWLKYESVRDFILNHFAKCEEISKKMSWQEWPEMIQNSSYFC